MLHDLLYSLVFSSYDFPSLSSKSTFIAHPHLLVRAIIERWVPTLVATSGSHWAKTLLKVTLAGRNRSLVSHTSTCGWAIILPPKHIRTISSVRFHPSSSITPFNLVSECVFILATMAGSSSISSVGILPIGWRAANLKALTPHFTRPWIQPFI